MVLADKFQEKKSAVEKKKKEKMSGLFSQDGGKLWLHLFVLFKPVHSIFLKKKKKKKKKKNQNMSK